MSLKPIIRRALASRGIEAAVDRYFSEAGEAVALRFVDALERAYRTLARSPGSGSPRYAYELGLQDLRFRPLRRFPYLVFYVERVDHIDVWRVLHGAADIPAWLNERSGN